MIFMKQTIVHVQNRCYLFFILKTVLRAAGLKN